jgi:hypothetical protein
MNLNDRVTRLENTLFGTGANPLLTGAYEHYMGIEITPGGSVTREWVENTQTGQRYAVTPEWRKMIDEYDAEMIRAGTPVEFDVILGTPTTTNPEDQQL